MKIKELKAGLAAANASWNVTEALADDIEVEELKRRYRTGALPLPPGTLTARMPVIRAMEAAPLRPFEPDVPPLRRRVLPMLPAVWDWRDICGENWVEPVRDQGGCGSCVAFATTGAIEAHQKIETNQPNLQLDLSEASLFFTANRQCNWGDPNYGWYVPAALDAMMGEGICFEENYPYRDTNQTALLVDGTTRTFKIQGYDSSSNTAQMKRWLVESGPLVTSFTVFTDFFAYWSGGSGVYRQHTGKVEGGHAVMVVGYDNNQNAWICKNSWGSPSAHQDGTFLIGYGECGIDSRMYVPQDVYDVITVDELSYDPTKLRIVDEGALGWLLTDGTSRMKMFDNKEDARNGLRVARRHTRHGFIGRDNPRTNRIDYITEYWSGSSGLPYEPLTKTDALPYDPNNVRAEDLDAKGWRIRDGNHWMLLAHDMNDALAILRVVERHTRMCFIGRGNTRPNRKSYIMTYWE